MKVETFCKGLNLRLAPIWPGEEEIVICGGKIHKKIDTWSPEDFTVGRQNLLKANMNFFSPPEMSYIEFIKEFGKH